MKKEIRGFFTALMFFTRIPCLKWVDHSPEYLKKSYKYLPLIGCIVGALAGAVYWLSALVFPEMIAVILSMISSIWITGALHEDGFADVCDGFGGGWTKEKILEIMKDSRVGAYGVIGLIMMLLLKFGCLFSLGNINEAWFIPAILISGHSLSRLLVMFISRSGKYVRSDGSKSTEVVSRMGMGEFMFSIITGIVPFALLSSYYVFLGRELIILAIIPPFIALTLLTSFYRKWIGGYTGDCLGASQQVCEVVFYLSVLALCR